MPKGVDARPMGSLKKKSTKKKKKKKRSERPQRLRFPKVEQCSKNRTDSGI